MEVKSLEDNYRAQQVIQRVQRHARPDGMCLPAQDGKQQSNHDEQRQ